MSRTFGTSTDYLRSNVTALTGYPLSMSVWAYPTSSARGIPMWYGNQGSNDGCFAIWFHENGDIQTTRQIVDFNSGPPNFVTAVAGSYTVNAWQQAGLAAASATSLYAIHAGVRGTEVTTSSTGLNFAVMDNITLGRYDRTSSFGYFGGQIAHAALWTAALTAEEWAMLGAGLSPLRVRPQSLYFYTPYIGRDTSDIDIIRGITMTATGATASTNEPPLLWGGQAP